jgi:hypothetical protein
MMSGMKVGHISAQTTGSRIVQADTIEIDTTYWEHSPRKAAMLSAVFPGMGQLYNKKYWKLPVVYIGMGALVYSSVWNREQYRKYFDKYKFMTETGAEEYEGETLREVEYYKDSHLRYKNLFMILSVGFYALQIIDANVDAHLLFYDISDDISLFIDPAIAYPSVPGFQVQNSPAFGLRCCLSF